MSKQKAIAIELNKVSKRYPLRALGKQKNFYALKNINLKINKGEKVAVLGNNGAGKTTLLKLITGIAQASEGQVNHCGNIISLIDLAAGFYPRNSGRENIYLNAVVLGVSLKKIKKIESAIIEFSGIASFIDRPLHTYSSGMILRLAFSIAVHCGPDIFVMDEGIVVGDNDFQKKAFDKVEEIFKQGKTIILCSHLLPLLRRLCNRFIWLEKGQLLMDGGQEVLLEYKKHCNSLMLEKMPNKKKAALVFNFLKDLPIGEKFIAIAGSGSMEPLVLKGDEVLIKRINFKNLKKGDIIAFWHQELKNVVVHRFHNLERGKIITKGDSNLYSDPGYVDRKNFLGLMIKVV